MVNGFAGKGDSPRPRQISDEENDLRWGIIEGKIKMTDEQFKKKIKEIRKRTGKP